MKSFPRFNIISEPGMGSTVLVNPEGLYYMAAALKRSGYDQFMFVTGIDFEDTIRLTYRINKSSPPKGVISIKADVSKKKPEITSVMSLWPAANWHERETYDLFGIKFIGHTNLKRLFMPEDWDGFPLRKDYKHERLVKRPDFI